MFCPKCGKKNADNAKFCASCGNAIPVAPVQPAAAPVEPVAVTPVEPVAVTPVEPVAVTPVEPVAVTPVEPVVVTPVEPVAVTPVEPVAVTPTESVVPPVQSMPVAEPVLGAVPSEQPAPKKKSKAGRIAVLSVIGVLVVAAAAVAIYMVITSNLHKQAVSRELTAAVECLGEEDYEGALAAYIAALELEPKDEEIQDEMSSAYVAWAGFFAEQNMYEEALNVLDTADERASKKTIKTAREEIELQQSIYEEELRLQAEREAEEERLRLEEEQRRLEEEARVKAGDYLTSYLNDTLIATYGLMDLTVTYESFYAHVGEGTDEDDVRLQFADCAGGVLAYDIRDYDRDGQVEMLVILVNGAYEGTYGKQNVVSIQMYESDMGNVVLSTEIPDSLRLLGGSDREYEHVYVQETADHVYIALDVRWEDTLVRADITVGVLLIEYDGTYFRAYVEEDCSGAEIYGDDNFEETAYELEAYGFYSSAALMRDGTYTHFEFDPYGDSMEQILSIEGENPYSADYTAYKKTSDYRLWSRNGDPAGLGSVQYVIEAKR